MDLGVDWDELDGFRKSSKIRSLLTHVQRREQLDELIAALREERDKLTWPNAAELAAALTTATPSHPQQRNRQNILNNIHHTWIEGILEPALHNDVALALDMSYQHDALSRPHRSLYPEEQPIPADTSLAQIFAARGRALLILGEPASGKTIALLQLLQELLTAAQADPNEPIPIVLNLSSWAREGGDLVAWIVEELLVQYQAPRQLSRDWLTGNQLTLLLDGLDEVAAEQREACVTAINSFKADHPADMVVCSRLADYEQLQAQLNLSSAIRLQPLTPSQIDDYLASFSAPLAGLRQAVATDDEWRELAQSPLMLNLMAFTFSETPLPAGGSLADKRNQLFTAYIKHNLHRRPLPPDGPYNEHAALTWLYHLAHQLQAHNQSVFYIEQLQPSWPPNPRSYRWLFGLIAGLIAGLIVSLVIGLIFSLITSLVVGLILGLIAGLVVWLLIGLFLGFKGGIGIRDESLKQFFVSDSGPIQLVEEIRWLRPHSPLLRSKIKQGLIAGLIFGLGAGLIFGLIAGLTAGLIAGLIVGLGGVLIFGLIAALESLIHTNRTLQRSQPNQGVRTSWHNARRTGPVYGLIVALIFGLGGGLIFALIGELIFGLGLGLVVGLMIGLMIGPMQYGGETVIKHYVLRWLLARQGMLPFPFRDRKLVAYLDGMAARLLLRRVGGGWMFIHRTLLEFLADEAEFQKLINDL